MVHATCVTLSDTLSSYQPLCRPWEALELMSPVFRRHQEKKSVKVIAETSVVNKTIRRVFEEQGLGKHLITIGGKCGADFAFFPDPAVDLCLGVKVSGTSPGKYPNVTRFAIDKTLPYLFLAIHNTGVALVPVRDITQSFNTVLGRSEFGLLELSCVPSCVQRVCQDLGEDDGLRLVSLSEVQGASKSAVKFMSPHMLEAEGQDLIEKNLTSWTVDQDRGVLSCRCRLWPTLGGELAYSNKDLFCHDKNRRLPIYADSKVRQHASDVHSPTRENNLRSARRPAA